jgi:hypothetical protein
MKHTISRVIAACILTLSSVSISKAQVNVNVNIGVQPLWGPTGYDVVEYYYLPDLQMYYYVPSHQFVYLSHGNWLFVSSLPASYRSYNLYSGYKVVINEPKPYLHFDAHKVKYGKYKGWKGKQVVIRDSREPKYFVVKGHPGNAKGHYKESGGGNSGGNSGGNNGGNNGNKGHGQGHGGGKGKKG